MTNRENFLSLLRRTGYQKVPIELAMCPSLNSKFDTYIAEKYLDFQLVDEYAYISDLTTKHTDRSIYEVYYESPLKEGTTINEWGIAHEPGSGKAHHMTRMLHPLKSADSVEQILSYPYPEYSVTSGEQQKNQMREASLNDLITIGSMQMTIWETAWYLRSMEELMADMVSDDPIAEAIFDKVTDIALLRAASYAKAGCDILFLGDDIGMQNSIMMSETLYAEWIKPRHKKIIDRAKEINPNILVFYHSCGYIKPFIPHFIELGIDVLNPVQPECMDFKEIHDMYSDKISFHGTIGTQTTMPFGTAEDVRNEVFKNLDIAGDKGGLLVAPTHLLEPEVPVENVMAYIQACKDYK